MLKKIQRFGGAMMSPVLFFAFTGLVVGICSVMKNTQIVGSIAENTTNWYKFWTLIEEGGWTVFRQMPLIFAIGLPIGLAKKAHARACLETFALYCTFNYFVSAILTLWNFGIDMSGPTGGTTGLTYIAGIKTLDTNLFGAIIIAAIVVFLHNKYFDKKLPAFLGVFQGHVFVYILGFFLMIPIAFLTVLIWPKVQHGIEQLQGFLVATGAFGVFIYTFLERILIPTGLHHFVYSPFIFGPAVVEGGIQTYWIQHINDFAASTSHLKDLFPAGGFSLHGNSKIFGALGIGLAMYVTSKSHKKKLVIGLLIPVVLTAMVSGITEPLEFTFLFLAPFLFFVHAVLAATMSTVMFIFGVVGNFGGGLLDFIFQNWLPMAKNHLNVMLIQISVGLVFTVIYFFVFKYLITRFDVKTPGREDDDNEDLKLYTKKDYTKKQNSFSNDLDEENDKALIVIEALGGKDNIEDINNCATRLRVSVKDPSKVADDKVFKQAGAHGVFRKDTAIQVIIGLSVSQFRENIEELLSKM